MRGERARSTHDSCMPLGARLCCGARDTSTKEAESPCPHREAGHSATTQVNAGSFSGAGSSPHGSRASPRSPLLLLPHPPTSPTSSSDGPQLEFPFQPYFRHNVKHRLAPAIPQTHVPCPVPPVPSLPWQNVLQDDPLRLPPARLPWDTGVKGTRRWRKGIT